MKNKVLSAVVSIGLLVGGCAWEPDLDGQTEEVDVSGDETKLTLDFESPEAFSVPEEVAETRAMTFAQETAIKEVYVLAFDQYGEIHSIKPGRDLEAANGTGKFWVPLKPSRTSVDLYNLVVLANSKAILEATIGLDVEKITAKKYADVRAALWAEIKGAMHKSSEPIPMWGESGSFNIKPGVQQRNVKLTRAVARVDIGVGKPTYNAVTRTYTWDGKDAKGQAIPFKMTSVYVQKPNDRYSLIPDKALPAGTPTVPAGTKSFPQKESQELFSFPARGVANGQGGWTSADIYIPEADVFFKPGGTPKDYWHTDRLAMVVGGVYLGEDGSGEETFYRLDFAKDDKLMNVLRNHLYQFNISKVSGDGFPTVVEAYGETAMNITVDVLQWDEEDMDDLVYNGSTYFGFSERPVTLEPLGGTKTITLRSNIEDGFEMSIGGVSRLQSKNIPAGGSQKWESTNFKYALSAVGTNLYSLEITCKQRNIGPSKIPITNEWTVKAGSLMTLPFEVVQQATDFWASIVDEEVYYLVAEGTPALTPKYIEVLTSERMTVTTEYTAGDGPKNWLTQDNTKTTDNFPALRLTVPAFKYGDPNDGNDGFINREVTLTLENSTRTKRLIYKIVQSIPEVALRSVTVTAGANGSANSSLRRATQGTKVELHATPAAGYVFDTWEVKTGGVTLANNNLKANPTHFFMGTLDVAINASFKRQLEPLSVVPNNSDWGSASGTPASPNAEQQVTLTAAPKTGYRFKGWVVINPATGVTLSTTSATPATFKMPSGLVSIRADFEPSPRTITVGAGIDKATNAAGGGTATATSVAASAGDRVSVTATPTNTSWIFKEWRITSDNSSAPVSPAPVLTTNPTSFIVPEANVSVIPVFARVYVPDIRYTTDGVVGNATGGNVTMSAPHAEAGGKIVLTAVPAAGYIFAGWNCGDLNGGSGTSLVSTSDPTTTLAMGTKGSAVRATFVKQDRPLSVVVNVSEWGSVTFPSAPKAGETVTLTAASKDVNNYEFDKWVVITGGVQIGSDNKFTMPAGLVSIRADFKQKARTIRVNAAQGGGGTASASKTSAVTGERVQLTAVPTVNTTTTYEFDGWTVNTPTTLTVDQTNPSSFIVPSSDVTVTPRFAQTFAPTLLYTTDGVADDAAGGSITVSAPRARAGGQIVVTAVPAAGYEFYLWAFGDPSGGSGTSLNTTTDPITTLTMGTNGSRIRAYFRKQSRALAVVVNNSDWGMASGSPATPKQGQEVTLTAASKDANKYEFDKWVVITGDVQIGSDNKFTMPAKTVSIRADFKRKTRTIRVTTAKLEASSGGTATATNGSTTSSTVTAVAGDRVSLKATPNESSILKSWRFTSTPAIAVTPEQTNPTSFIVPEGDVSVEAYFVRVYTPYVYPNNANYGSAIKSVPSVEAGGEMTIVATSKPNYVFQKWEISNPTTCTDATIVTPDSPTSILRVGVTTPNVRAVFVAQSTEQPLVVVPNNSDWGRASASPGTPSTGAKVTLSHNANTGYRFKQWTVMGGGVQIASDNTFTMPAGLVSIRADFEPAPRKVTISQQTGGTASATSGATTSTTSVTVAAGDLVSLKATVATGYAFSGWTFATNPQTVAISPTPDQTNPTTIKVPAGDVTVTPGYTRVYTLTTEVSGDGVVTQSAPYGAAGSTIALNATPGPGQEFLIWRVSDEATNAGWFFNPIGEMSTAITVGTRNATVTAVFQKQKKQLSVVSNNDQWGTVYATPGNPSPGNPVVLGYTLKSNYEFVGWECITRNVNIAQNSSGQWGFTMHESQAVTIRGVFREKTYEVTAPANANYRVKITVESGGASIGTSTSTGTTPAKLSVRPTDHVVVECLPGTGYGFKSWNFAASGDNGNEPVNPTLSNPGSFEMPSNNVTVTATVARYYTVKTSVEGLGRIVQSAAGGFQSDRIDLTAVPNDGSTFVGWTITGRPEIIGTTMSTNPALSGPAGWLRIGTENLEVKATFATGYAVTIGQSNPTGGGSAISDHTTAYAGEKVTLLATPAQGYMLTGWTFKNASGSAVTPAGLSSDLAANTASFTMPAYPVTVGATYQQRVKVLLLQKTGGTLTVTPAAAATMGVPKGTKITITSKSLYDDSYDYLHYDFIASDGLDDQTLAMNDGNYTHATLTGTLNADVAVQGDYRQGILIGGYYWATREVFRRGRFVNDPMTPGSPRQSDTVHGDEYFWYLPSDNPNTWRAYASDGTASVTWPQEQDYSNNVALGGLWICPYGGGVGWYMATEREWADLGNSSISVSHFAQGYSGPDYYGVENKYTMDANWQYNRKTLKFPVSETDGASSPSLLYDDGAKKFVRVIHNSPGNQASIFYFLGVNEPGASTPITWITTMEHENTKWSAYLQVISIQPNDRMVNGQLVRSVDSVYGMADEASAMNIIGQTARRYRCVRKP